MFSSDVGTMSDPNSRVDSEVSSIISHCSLYGFVLETCLMGPIILCGLVTNTIACAVLWQEKRLTAPVFLLQAVLIADIAVLWMLFISETVPSLAYVVTILQQCELVCHYIYCITRPLLFLAQACGILFTLWAIMNRYIVLCKPTMQAHYSDFGFAKKQAIATIVFALLCALPMTMDTVLRIPLVATELEDTELLIDNKYYFSIYINGVVFALFYFIPILAIVFYCFKLARVIQSVRNLRRILEPGYKMENIDITQVMLAIGATLFICYLPKLALTITQLVDLGSYHTHCGDLQYYLHAFSNLFVSINASSKLLILYVFARRFRQSLRGHFCASRKHKCKNRACIYKCGDISEMTLISDVDRATPLKEDYIFQEDD